MACGSCGLQLSFGRKRRRGSKRKQSKRKQSRRKNRRSRSRKNRSGSRRRSHRRRGRKSRRGRKFGIVAGPGFKGQTSYSNAYAPYYGSREPFIAASQWWAPITGGVPQYPQMLYKNAGPVNYPGN
jgi:hypothetical protein